MRPAQRIDHRRAELGDLEGPDRGMPARDAVGRKVVAAVSPLCGGEAEFRVQSLLEPGDRQTGWDSPTSRSQGVLTRPQSRQAKTKHNMHHDPVGCSRSSAGAATTLPVKGSPCTRLASPSHADAAARRGASYVVALPPSTPAPVGPPPAPPIRRPAPASAATRAQRGHAAGSRLRCAAPELRIAASGRPSDLQQPQALC